MKSDDFNSKARRIFIKRILFSAACIIILIPLASFFAAYYIPPDMKPYYIDLTGEWKIVEEKKPSAEGKVHIPGMFSKQGFKGDYLTIEREIELKDEMRGRNLFLIVAGVPGGFGRVFVNGKFAGEIGHYQEERKERGVHEMTGFMIPAHFFNSNKNDIAISFHQVFTGYDGIQDPRFYLGVSERLSWYYYWNTTVESFFQNGIIIVGFFILFSLGVFLINERGKSERKLYLKTMAMVLSSVTYNLFFSHILISRFIPINVTMSVMLFCIDFMVLAMSEFIFFYYFEKNMIFTHINRFIFLFFAVFNLVFILSVYYPEKAILILSIKYMYYFFVIIFCLSISVLKAGKNFNPVIIFSLAVMAITGGTDMLSDVGLLNTPKLITITISVFTIMSAFIVIVKVMDVSIKNRLHSSHVMIMNELLEKKVLERTLQLEKEKIELKKRNEIFENDLMLARSIQMKTISMEAPLDEISFIYKPARRISCDYLEFITLKNSRMVGLFVSDVSGHGLSAALITSMIKSNLIKAGRYNKPSAVMEKLNDVLFNQTGDNYVAAFYCVFDPVRKRLVYSSAGHTAPLIVKEKIRPLYEFPESIPLGILPNMEQRKTGKCYHDRELFLEKGSKLILFTKGLINAAGSGAYSGEGKLLESILRHTERSSGEFVRSIYSDLVNFRGNDDFEDDICFICIDIK